MIRSLLSSFGESSGIVFPTDREGGAVFRRVAFGKLGPGEPVGVLRITSIAPWHFVITTTNVLYERDHLPITM